MVTDNCQQSIQSCVHTGDAAYQPYPFPTFLCSAGPRRFCQFLQPFFRFCMTDPPTSTMCLRCKTGRRGTAPAAIPPSLSAGICKFFSTPFADLFHMGLIHCQQIAEPAAVGLSPLFPRQGCSAKRTLFRRHFLRWMRLVIFLPPFDLAGITAKFSLTPCSPFRLELLSAIWIYLLWVGSLSPFCQYLLVVVCYSALIAAESPPSSWPAFFLIDYVPTGRAGIYWYFIVPFRVVVPMPTGVTAELLSRYVAGWYKFLPTI